MFALVLAIAAWTLPAAALGPGDFTGDVTASVLVALSVSPATADVTSASATFAVTMVVTDDLSGTQTPSFGYMRVGTSMGYGGGIVQLNSGTNLNGTWTGSFSFPRYTPGGHWEYGITLTDNAGNQRNYSSATLAADGFPSSFDTTDTNPDDTPPTITGVSGPTTIDVRNGPATVYFQVTATDTQSGVTQLSVGTTSPLGNYDWGGVTGGLDGITSGDAHSGVWTIQLNFPQYTRSGHWTLFLVAFDALQNMTWMDASALSAAGFNAGIDVVSNPDLQPPQFVTASVTPTAIDVHDQDQTITVTAHVTDDLSGLGSVGGGSYAVGTILRGPTSSIQRGATQRLSGTALDGMYQEPITIPRLSPTGLWSLGLEASDNVNNSTGWIEGTKVVSLGLPQYLLIYNVPFPPALVSVDPADGSATITWSPPTDDQGAPVTQYVITVSPGGVKVDTSGAVTATVIGGLTNGVRYSFSAQAVNKAGASTASPVLTAVPSAQPVSQPGGATLSSSGYWMLGSDGTVHTFGRAPFLGDAPVTAPAVRLTPTPSRRGYWIVDAGGHVYAFGDAPYLGGASGLSKGEVVTSLSATPSTQGYWLFTNRGRVLPFGDAAFLGDMSGTHLNGVALDSVPTPSGNGYYMVAADGGVFCFGDAHFNGSMGSTKLNAPVESLVPDPDGSGYWLVASDGGIFAFDAPFYGSMGGHPLNKPVTGMVGSSAGGGYLMVAADGGVFTFGKIAFQGSLGNAPPAVPIVAAATF